MPADLVEWLQFDENRPDDLQQARQHCHGFEPFLRASRNKTRYTTIRSSKTNFCTLGYFMSAKAFVASRCCDLRSGGQTKSTQSISLTFKQTNKEKKQTALDNILRKRYAHTNIPIPWTVLSKHQVRFGEVYDGKLSIFRLSKGSCQSLCFQASTREGLFYSEHPHEHAKLPWFLHLAKVQGLI